MHLRPKSRCARVCVCVCVNVWVRECGCVCGWVFVGVISVCVCERVLVCVCMCDCQKVRVDLWQTVIDACARPMHSTVLAPSPFSSPRPLLNPTTPSLPRGSYPPPFPPSSRPPSLCLYDITHRSMRASFHRLTRPRHRPRDRQQRRDHLHGRHERRRATLVAEREAYDP